MRTPYIDNSKYYTLNNASVIARKQKLTDDTIKALLYVIEEFNKKGIVAEDLDDIIDFTKTQYPKADHDKLFSAYQATYDYGLAKKAAIELVETGKDTKATMFYVESFGGDEGYSKAEEGEQREVIITVRDFSDVTQASV